MSIGTVRNSSLGFEVNGAISEKETDSKVTLFKPTIEFSKSFALFSLRQETEVTSLVWSFLSPENVGITALVSKLWNEVASSNSLWATLHKRTFSSENKVPSVLGSARACKELYLETKRLFPDGIGERFYSKHLGEVKVLPIPEIFISRAKEVDPFDPEGRLVRDTHQLVYVPKEIAITVPACSKLFLNEEGCLIEGVETTEKERILIVPVTLNNLLMLTSKCFKNGKEGRLAVIGESSGKKILLDHGNKPVKSHFSYQKKEVVGLNTSYEAQTLLAKTNHYEVPSLIDRVLLNMGAYASFGSFVDHSNMTRTSTSVELPGITYQSVSWDVGSFLFLFCSVNDDNVGVAVEVPLDFVP